MSQINLQVNALAFSDNQASNNPLVRNFDLTYKIPGISVDNPSGPTYKLAPGEVRTIYNGTRTLAIDGTTAFDVSLPDPSTNIYRLTASAGTPPSFRTDRLPGVDGTTVFTMTMSGPVATFTAPSVAAVPASFSGQVAGMTTDVTLTAVTAGTVGNSIALTGDGTSSISSLISAWNIANPSNQVGLTSGDGTQIPSLSAVIQLANGANAITGINTTNIVVGDILKLEPGVGNSATNQGEFVIIAKTASSISIKNVNGTGETWTVLDPTKFYVYSSGGGNSNQVQIGDTVILSMGFSPASLGSYEISDVTPNWIEFSVGSQGGLPLETGIMPTAAGMVIYSAAKTFALIACVDTISVRFNADASDNTQVIPSIEPNNVEKPGLLLKTGPYYMLVIHNMSLNPTEVLVASGE